MRVTVCALGGRPAARARQHGLRHNRAAAERTRAHGVEQRRVRVAKSRRVRGGDPRRRGSGARGSGCPALATARRSPHPAPALGRAWRTEEFVYVSSCVRGGAHASLACNEINPPALHFASCTYPESPGDSTRQSRSPRAQTADHTRTPTHIDIHGPRASDAGTGGRDRCATRDADEKHTAGDLRPSVAWSDPPDTHGYHHILQQRALTPRRITPRARPFIF